MEIFPSLPDVLWWGLAWLPEERDLSLRQAGHEAQWELCGDTSPLQPILHTHTASPSTAALPALPCSATAPCSPWKAPTAPRIWGLRAWRWVRKMGKGGSWSCSCARPKGCGNALVRAGTLIPQSLTSAQRGWDCTQQPWMRGKGGRLLSTSKPGCQEGTSLSLWGTCAWGSVAGCKPWVLPSIPRKDRGPINPTLGP